jgi:hypothetical protein
MKRKMICILWLSLISCTDAVVFDRNNPNDPGNPDYVPHAPLNLILSRQERDHALRWFQYPSGSDSLWIFRSVKGSPFEKIAVIPSTALEYVDSSRMLDYPTTYRVQSVFNSTSGPRISEAAEISLPEPVLGVAIGQPVGTIGFNGSYLTGSISDISALFGYRFEFVSPEYALTTFSPSFGSLWTFGGRGVLSLYDQYLFESTPCLFQVEASLQVTLPSPTGERVVAEYPLAGSPFLVPYFQFNDQIVNGSVYEMTWETLRNCPDCMVTVRRSTDQGAQWVVLDQVPLLSGSYENTSAGATPWYRLDMSCRGKSHPQTLNFQF